ncbi:hypothetical protein F8568_027285 [Actinomadura sp. LD22]|uniref:Uncharacterized protein n=1 Tax=Actinomadura physcomitrii TaxID=2650748 RepID=A0A6I4MMQ0_9ACTN|nr:DUF6069 family protein [Actinomadura physcomitrii]MWA04019.1 hypothetical protein [Actinomadura physcomitrii]
MNEMTGTRPATAGAAARRALTVAAAAGAALLVWVAADPIGGAGMHARGQHVGPAAVIVSTLLIGLAGWGLLAVLERRAKRPGRTWGITAGIVLGLSMTGPLDSEGPGTYLALTAMHLIVGAVLIAGLGRTARVRR